MDQQQIFMFEKLGLVRIDGKRIYQNMMVPQTADMKAFTPQGIHVEKPITKLWMINKPRGYICSHRDPQKRPSIYQLLPQYFKNFGHIISVGRLDFNSQGLLLLTNDAKLKSLLQNPVANLTRVYRVKVHGRVTPQKLQKMSSPLLINGQQYGPLQVTVDRSLSTNVWMNVAMKTGKNRQIRRIMQKCDLQVSKLIRLQYGKYKLNTLKHGEVKQVLISQGVQRKLKLQKAKQLSKNRPCLIQIDIRQKAIQIASQQHRKRLQEQKKQNKQSQKLINNKQLRRSKEQQKQDQSQSQDD